VQRDLLATWIGPQNITSRTLNYEVRVIVEMLPRTFSHPQSNFNSFNITDIRIDHCGTTSLRHLPEDPRNRGGVLSLCDLRLSRNVWPMTEGLGIIARQHLGDEFQHQKNSDVARYCLAHPRF